MYLKGLAFIKQTTVANRTRRRRPLINLRLRNLTPQKKILDRSSPKAIHTPQLSDPSVGKTAPAKSGPKDPTIKKPMPHCPICNTIVHLRAVSGRPATVTAPFCSERCKNIDLGRWLDESYSVPDAATESGDDDDGESYSVRY